MNPYELELNVICWFYEDKMRKIENQTLSWTFFFDTEEEYIELKERLDNVCNKHTCSSIKEYYELLIEIDDISNENYIISDLGRTIEFSVETEKMKREKEQLKKKRLEQKNKMVDKEGLLKEIIEDITKLYDDFYEEELCNYYEKFMPCPYFKKGKCGCENHEKCELYLKDLIKSLCED